MLFGSVQSHSRAWFFASPAARQASLSITNSQSLLKLISIESVMPSNHLIFYHPLLLLPSIFPASGSFPMSQLFSSGGQSIGASASSSVLPLNTQDWSPLGMTAWHHFKLRHSVCRSSYQGSARPSFYAADIIQFINNLFKILPDQSL